MDPAVLSKLMETKKPTKPGGKKPFSGRQQQAFSQAAPKTVTIAATAPVTNQTNLADGSNQQFSNYTGGFRGGRGGYATTPKTVTIAATAPVTNQTNLADGSNQQFSNYTGGFRGGRGGYATSRYRLHQFQEAWGWLTSDCWLQETIANGYSLPLNKPPPLNRHPMSSMRRMEPKSAKVVQEVLALSMERESIPVPGITIWDVPITAGFYQNHTSSNTMGSPARDQNVRLPGRSLDNGVVKRRMFEINTVCLKKMVQLVHSAPRYEDQHQVHDASGTREKGPRPPGNSNRNDKSRYGYNQSHCVICLQGPSNDSGDTSGAPEAPQTYGVEDQLFEGKPEMDIGSHNNGASIRESDLRHWMGGRCWNPELLRFLARAPHEIEYQCKIIADNVICGPTPLSCWKLGISLLRQYHNISIRSQVWRNNLPQITGNCRANMESLLVYRDTPTGHLHPVSIEPGRCAIDVDCPDRMGDFPYHLQGNPGPLVPRQGSRSNRRLHAAMVSMEERVLLPTVELDPLMAIGNVIPRPNEVGNPPTNILTCNSGGARPQKRQVALDEEQVLVLKIKPLTLFYQTQEQMRMRNYDHTQKHSLAWCINQDHRRYNFGNNSTKKVGTILRSRNQTFDIKTLLDFIDLWFLRASDIRRIYNSMIIISNDVLRLVVLAPKEKRGGQPIMKPCEIQPHADPLLCPVEAYKSYILHVKNVQCVRKHDNHPDTTLSMLVRHIRDFTKPLSVDSISRHVHMLSDLIVRPPNTPRLKTRALGPTLAAAAGLPSSDIVS
ncbi:hypothetical protein AYI69_g3455 [Smittium culicis]|uniref:Uncharacterized protein n=1 Tax=Smittium culicis TaxID=133412 RepID=A0A1R1YJR9_9FUNG|nr:hypothetical protein AYI69_g3455 [Smittium culicis]